MTTYELLKQAVESKGYKFFEGEMNINLIGVRSSNVVTNEFDDTLLVAFELNGQKIVLTFKDFTTDPGFYYLKQKFLNPKGCAILKPGQYPGMWTIGKHRGKYPALVQVGKCTVYRDRDGDNQIDTDTEQSGLFGINMHHGYDAEDINKYSAGCQVHSHDEQLNVIIALCEMSAVKWGDAFTYTLLEKADIEI